MEEFRVDRIYDKKKSLVEINFLCVHKKLRAKRLAPVLIREITRRVNITGIFQVRSSLGLELPTKVYTKDRKNHREGPYKGLFLIESAY